MKNKLGNILILLLIAANGYCQQYDPQTAISYSDDWWGNTNPDPE